ncbi:MAG: FecR family protein [Prevotella sp.]|jgi:ferric-dicitrate binding protein FerR (iron transport regulator)|nr:FecR family protein [Prevotella sp.]
MSKTKSILKKYFENFYSEEVQLHFISWLKRKGDNPEIEETLEEIWNDINVPANNLTHNELNALKEKLGILQSTKKLNYRYKLNRIAVYISAACIVLAVLIFSISRLETTSINRKNIFAQLNATNIDSIKATTIVAGNVVAITEDNDSIKQTKEGGIIINEKEEAGFNNINSELVQVVVPKGKRSQVRFSDGTIAWLNSGTKLIYPKKFDDKRREIYIDGELYLEVAKDAERSFIVNTQNMSVKVLGTRFNIRSYVEESEQSVVLVEGTVEVESANKKSKEMLSPNQAIFYRGKTIEKKEVDVNNYICWKDGELRLHGESLRTIFDRLSKHYNVKIVYTEKDENRRYKGKLFLDSSIEDVLNVIAIKAEFTFIFSKESNTIYVNKLYE